MQTASSPASLAFPASAPYVLLLDWGTVSAEAVLVTAVSGSGPYTYTITRGIDGTTATTHLKGATVYHGTTGQDYGEYQAHANATGQTTYSPSGSTVLVHGIASTSAVVGLNETQTLTNKTLTGPVMTNPEFSLSNTNQLIQLYNVMDPAYGATGNGSTDDTAAIQSHPRP